MKVQYSQFYGCRRRSRGSSYKEGLSGKKKVFSLKGEALLFEETIYFFFEKIIRNGRDWKFSRWDYVKLFQGRSSQ